MPSHKIKTALARQLVLNYKTMKLGRQLREDDTHAVWFPKEVLLDALNATDLEPGATVSGLRFYLGAYDNEHQPEVGKKEKLTLVIVQTKKVGEAQKDILEDPTAHPAYLMPKLAEPVEFNDGQLCPPPGCDEDGLLKFPPTP